MNGSRKKKQRKAQTKMGEIHQRYVLYDGSSKQSGGGPAPREATQALLTRMLREEIHNYKQIMLRQTTTTAVCNINVDFVFVLHLLRNIYQYLFRMHVCAPAQVAAPAFPQPPLRQKLDPRLSENLIALLQNMESKTSYTFTTSKVYGDNILPLADRRD